MWWRGAQREMLAGRIGSVVALDRVVGADVSAVGPGADVSGEVTVIAGRDTFSRVASDGEITVAPCLGQHAAFLVWARVGAWREARLKRPLATLAELGERFEEIAAAAGAARDEPFVVRIEARLAHGSFHVLDRCPDAPEHSPEEHERAKVRFVLGDEPASIVVFMSRSHGGVFIPQGSSLHAHVVARGGRVAGHLDPASFASALLLVPQA
jgi:hypothetical protein